MRKNIKYSISSIVIILSLIFGFIASAEDNNTPEDTQLNNNLNREENKIKREQAMEAAKNEAKNMRDELESKREMYKIKIEQMMQQTKLKREEFKKELELKKEESKLKFEELKNKLREGLTKIKDEKKKISAEKIVSNIEELNIKRTDQLTEKINQIENVLFSINSRISKAENKILNVSEISSKLVSAEKAIELARSEIQKQISKTYSISKTITDESSLRTEMKKLRDTFGSDIKALNEKIKLAHTAVRDTATTLAKVPRVDEDEISNVVENDNTTNNN